MISATCFPRPLSDDEDGRWTIDERQAMKETLCAAAQTYTVLLAMLAMPVCALVQLFFHRSVILWSRGETLLSLGDAGWLASTGSGSQRDGDEFSHASTRGCCGSPLTVPAGRRRIRCSDTVLADKKAMLEQVMVEGRMQQIASTLPWYHRIL